MKYRKILPLAFAFAMTQNVNAADADTQNKLYPQHFGLSEVTLGNSPMRDAMLLNIKVLMDYDADRLMTPFVRQAGLAATTNTASPYYRWTTKHPTFSNWGQSDWSLEGHVGGHYITALALAIAATDGDASLAAENAKLRERMDYCLGIMKDCQDAYATNTAGLKGFIGGQPINQVWTGLYANSLTDFKKYGGWVPFYCQHKVLAGLRDAYVYAGSETAKELFRGLSDWSVNVVSKLSTTDMQTVLGWEHGGMNETLADAYHIFGEKKYLDAAKKYSHTYEINGMQSLNKSFLDGQHANTQVPKFIGFERIWQLDNSVTSYQKAAHNFWQDVVENRTVCIGGNSVDEHFLSAANAANYISNLNGPESCNTNNMLKLSESLFDETHDGKYADFYEQAMLNHILSTQDPTTGGYVYFTTLRPQAYRIYSKVNQAMWCCVGTGMENHSKYGHFIYTHQQDGEGKATLYVNLFVASELNSTDFGMKQETQFPYSPDTKLTVTKQGNYAIAVRKPSWTTADYDIKVNGESIMATATTKDGYVYIDRLWNKDDVIDVTMPMTLRAEACPNLKEYTAFKYGPVLLAARTTVASQEESEATGLAYEALQNEYGGEGRMDHAPGSRASSRAITSSPVLICNPDTVLNLITPKDLSKLEFTISAPADIENNAPSSIWNKTSTLTLEPFANIHHARYTCYWFTSTKEDFATSDIGQSEAINAALNDRTLDYVGTGEQQSEAGHLAIYSAGSSTGSYNGEFYRDAQANGYIQYTLENTRKLTDSLAIMCRFTVADKGRKGTVMLDGTKIGDVTVPTTYATQDDKGFYNIEFAIPAELLVDANGNAKDSLVFRLNASSSTLCPGLYQVRLVKKAGADDASRGNYTFIATDWTTGDAGRVAASKFTYDRDNNTFTVNAGTGANNVALMMSWQGKNYTVGGLRKYLTVRGTNLSTASAASYLWWLNGVNRGTQVAPTKVQKLPDGDIVIAWDVTQSGIGDKSTGILYNVCQGQTIFGLTSTTGTSTIKEITFCEDIEDYLNGATGTLSVAAGTPASATAYDLSGKKSSKAAAGIKIENGRKIARK